MRLDTMRKMEVDYLEEIEDLKKMLEGLTRQLEEERRRAQHPDQRTNKCTVEIVQQVEQLQADLEIRERKIADLESQNAFLRDRIDILEIRKESVCRVLL